MLVQSFKEMTGADRMIRAKVKLQLRQPFFSYLLMNMKIIRDDTFKTMAVDNRDRIFYNEDFVRGLSEQELIGVLCHEVTHRILNHITRGRTLQYPRLANIAADIKVNAALTENGFTLPQGALVSNSYDKTIRVQVGYHSKVITDLDSKGFEDIYHEIREMIPENERQQLGGVKIKIGGDGGGQGSGNGGGDAPEGESSENPDGFDQHVFSQDEKTPQEEKESAGDLSEKWKDILSQAAAIAKSKGTVPAGFESIIGELLEPKIPWRQKLYKYMTAEIPCDFSWARPSKRSVCTGIYMPHMYKESIEMVCHIDTSGSISDDEMRTFMTEIYSVLNAFSSINMTLLMCDAEIQAIHTLDATNRVDVAEGRIKRVGNGGTSHIPVVDWINDNKPNARLFMSFTDGYSNIESCFENLPGNTKRIILLPHEYQGMASRLEDYGEIVIVDN